MTDKEFLQILNKANKQLRQADLPKQAGIVQKFKQGVEIYSALNGVTSSRTEYVAPARIKGTYCRGCESRERIKMLPEGQYWCVLHGRVVEDDFHCAKGKDEGIDKG